MDGAPPDDVVLTQAELDAGAFAACKSGNAVLLAQVIAKELTPLHYAAMGGHTQCVELILAAGGADAYRERLEAAGDEGGAAASGGPQRRVVNSPLHWAVQRGHVRAVWALLGSGFSGLDLDAVGNSALHLAAGCGVPSRAAQLEVLRAVMHAGFDPECRNWYGQRPIDMLPAEATEARALLAGAAAETRCASTGTPFGAEELRFLCAASGRCFCEDASVGQSVAAAPHPETMGLLGTGAALLAALEALGGGAGGSGSRPSAAATGRDAMAWPPFLPSPAALLSQWQQQQRLLALVLAPGSRMGEGAAVAAPPPPPASAPAPATAAAARSRSSGGEGPTAVAAAAPQAAAAAAAAAHASPAASPFSPPTAASFSLTKPVRFGADNVYRVTDAESSLESALQAASLSLALAASPSVQQAQQQAGGSNPFSSVSGLGAPSPRPDTAPASPQGPAADDGARLGGPAPVVPSLRPQGPGMDTGGAPEWPPPAASPRGSTAGGAPGPAGAALAPELYFGPSLVAALEAAVEALSEARGDVALEARGRLALLRVRAAAGLVAAADALTTRRRPLSSRVQLVPLQACARLASDLGLAPTLLAEVAAAVRAALAEVDLAGAVRVCGAVAVGTHVYDADMARLRGALEEAEAANATIATLAAEAAADVGAAPEAAAAAPSAAAAAATAASDDDAAAAAAASGLNETAAASEGDGDTRGGGGGSAAGSSGPAALAPLLPGSSSSVVSASAAPLPTARTTRNPKSVPALVPISSSVVAAARALLQRLQSEVTVSDSSAALEAARRGLATAVALHGTTSPLVSPLPTPPLSPEETAFIAEALAAAAEAAAYAAACAEAKAAGRRPPNPPKPKAVPRPVKGAPPVPPPAFKMPPPTRGVLAHAPCGHVIDPRGLPLPITPQLEALAALKAATGALAEEARVAAERGAAEACVAGAAALGAAAVAEWEAGLLAERTRVDAARLAAPKKRGGGAPAGAGAAVKK